MAAHTAIKTVLATAAAVSPSAVHLTLTAGSVLVTADISFDTILEAASGVSRLYNGVLSDAASLETALNARFTADGLGLTTTVQELRSAPQAVGLRPSPPLPPQPPTTPAPAPSSAVGLGGVISGRIVGAVAGMLVVLLILLGAGGVANCLWHHRELAMRRRDATVDIVVLEGPAFRLDIEAAHRKDSEDVGSPPHVPFTPAVFTPRELAQTQDILAEGRMAALGHALGTNQMIISSRTMSARAMSARQLPARPVSARQLSARQSHGQLSLSARTEGFRAKASRKSRESTPRKLHAPPPRRV